MSWAEGGGSKILPLFYNSNRRMVVILNVNIITKKLIQTALTYSFECAELKAELLSQHATTAYRSLNLPKHSQADKDYKLSVFSEVEGLLIGKRWLLK